MLVACDAAGGIGGISETFRRSSQQTRVPGNTLREVLLVVFTKKTLSRFKDQREGRGVIRGFREKQACLRCRPEHLLREGLRMKCTVVYRRGEGSKRCRELGVLCAFCDVSHPKCFM